MTIPLVPQQVPATSSPYAWVEPEHLVIAGMVAIRVGLSGPAFLLVHGGPEPVGQGHEQDLLSLGQKLADAGGQAFGIDYRTDTWEHARDDIAAASAAVAALAGSQPVIVAHSFGGYPASLAFFGGAGRAYAAVNAVSSRAGLGPLAGWDDAPDPITLAARRPAAPVAVITGTIVPIPPADDKAGFLAALVAAGHPGINQESASDHTGTLMLDSTTTALMALAAMQEAVPVTYTQVHVSEVPDNPVVECTWATGLELARAALWGTAKEPPATTSEREALRVAGGGSDTAGANYGQLAHGCQQRYGWSPAVSSVLPPPPGVGWFYGVQGLYSALPDHYRRWDGNFTGGHSSVVYNLDGTLMWCDPLAPWNTTSAGGVKTPWQGEPITWGVVTAYFKALPGARVASARLNVPPRAYSLLIPAHAVVEHSSMNAKGQVVLPWQRDTWGASPSSAPCTAATTRPTTVAGVTAAVVRVLGGKYASQWVHMNGQVRVIPR